MGLVRCARQPVARLLLAVGLVSCPMGMKAGESTLARGQSEVIAQRGMYQKAFDNGDGSLRYVIGGAPMHFQDNVGEWKEIDTTILPADEVDAAFAMTRSIYKAFFRERFDGRSPVVRMSKDGFTVSVTPGELAWINAAGEREVITEARGSAASVDGNVITYRSAYGSGADFVYQTHEMKLSKRLVLSSLDALPACPAGIAGGEGAALEITLILDHDASLERRIGSEALGRANISGGAGIPARSGSVPATGRASGQQAPIPLAGQRLEFLLNGKLMWFFAPPRGWDEAGSKVEGEALASAETGRVTLRINFPLGWLLDTSGAITLDPDTYYGDVNDGYIEGRDTDYATARVTPTIEHADEPTLEVGQGFATRGARFWVQRSFLAFDTSGVSGTINQVNLSMFGSWTKQATNRQDFDVRIHQCAWSQPLSAGISTTFGAALTSALDAVHLNTGDIGSEGRRASSPNLDATYVNRQGMTCYALVAGSDWDGVAPVPGNYDCAQFGSFEADMAERPYLEVFTGAVPDRDSVIRERAVAQVFPLDGTEVVLWELELSDRGTSDGLDTTLMELGITLGGSVGVEQEILSDMEFRLNGIAPILPFDLYNNPRLDFRGLQVVARNGAPGIALRLTARVFRRPLEYPYQPDGYRLSCTIDSMTVETAGSWIASGQVHGGTTQLDVGAARLDVTTQPVAMNRGEPFAVVPVIAALAAYGCQSFDYLDMDAMPVTVALVLGTGSPSATLQGTTTVNSLGGRATFPGLSIDRAGVGFVLEFSAPGLPPVRSAPFDVAWIADEDSNYSEAFYASTLPLDGSWHTLWEVSLNDAGSGDQAPTEITELSLNLRLWGTPLWYSQTQTVELELNGVPPSSVNNNMFGHREFRFTGMSIVAPDGGRGSSLVFSARFGYPVANPEAIDQVLMGLDIKHTMTVQNGSDVGARGTSRSFTISAGFDLRVDASHMAVQAQPGGAVRDRAFANQPVLWTTDEWGNLDLDGNETIRASIVSGTGTPGAILSGGVDAVASLGRVVFSGLKIDRSGRDYVLEFSARGLAPVRSAPFTVGGGGQDNDSAIVETNFARALDTGAGVTPLWTLEVRDFATSDSLDTVVSEIAFQVTIANGGATTLAAFDWSLEGIGSIAFVDAANGIVTFRNIALQAANGGVSAALTLNARFRAGGGADPLNLDGATLDIAVRSLLLDPAGSIIATALPLHTPGSVTINVVASELRLLRQPPPQVEAGVGFEAAIEFVDAHGNRDRDVAGDVVTVARSDNGEVIAGGSMPAQDGIAAFVGGQEIMLGGHAAIGIVLTFTDDTGAPLTGSADVSGSAASAALDLVAQATVESLDGFALQGGAGCASYPRDRWASPAAPGLLLLAMLCAMRRRRAARLAG